MSLRRAGGDEPLPVDVLPNASCEECDDAVAVGAAWFNGRTLTLLCADCLAWWENHGLIEPKDEAFFAPGDTTHAD